MMMLWHNEAGRLDRPTLTQNIGTVPLYKQDILVVSKYLRFNIVAFQSVRRVLIAFGTPTIFRS